MSRPAPAEQPYGFLLVYALAVAGGAVAYVPFLTILLPLMVTRIAGAENVDLLVYATFSGAVAASLANIGFGWLSDRTGSRRGWIAAGLILSCGMLLLIARIEEPALLIAALVVWQLGLNMMLSPLTAWAGDMVPDSQKGLLGGLLSFAPALGALSGVVVTWPGLVAGEARFALVAGMVAAMVLPALILGSGRRRQELMEPVPVSDHPAEQRPLRGRSAVTRMWLARLLVQIAEAALFAFLLFWLRSLDADFPENRMAMLFGVSLAVAVPVTLALGRWSDRLDRPITPLVVMSGLVALGLAGMAMAPSVTFALAAYVLFAVAGTVFLSLHSSQTLRVLPKPQTRGRDLGFFNLTNTIPSLIMPWLTLALVPVFGFEALFALLAVLSLSAMFLLMAIARPA